MAVSLVLFLLFTGTLTYGGDFFGGPPALESTEAPKTTAAPTTTVRKETTSSSADQLVNSDILGCSYPDDFLQRYKFCANKAGFDIAREFKNTDIKYGVLDREILDDLMENCEKDSLDLCVKKLDSAALDQFIDVWFSSTTNYSLFQDCIQQNTEAMNRLCGKESDVSRIVSGAAGLHLNLLSVLINVYSEAENQRLNISQNCIRKVAEATHITAALYIKSKHYKDNAVFCWDVVRHTCSKQCAAYAAELNCLHAECLDLPFHVIQDFGIWQWYFLDTRTAREKCGIRDDKCTVTDDGTVSQYESSSSLFDIKNLRKKFRVVKKKLEKTLHLPFKAILAIFVGCLFAFFACITLACMCRYGLIGEKRSKNRYSRLMGDGYRKDEAAALTGRVEDDDFE